jgi:Uma2 family endonuclease
MATATRSSVNRRPARNSYECMEVIHLPTSAFTLARFCEWMCSGDAPPYCKISFLGGEVWITDWLDDVDAIVIPGYAATLTGFRRWATSNQFPRRGRIAFVNNEIVIDMSPEKFESHGKVIDEVERVILNLNLERDLGEYCRDRTLLTNDAAGLSREPDGAFLLWETLESGRAKLIPARKGKDYIEVRGTPDWVLEVVSDSSVSRDIRDMRRVFHRAGIGEYWLIDARGKEIVFQILYRTRSGYSAAPRKDGWQKSKVFGCSFQLVRHRGRMEMWRYRLLVKTE